VPKVLLAIALVVLLVAGIGGAWVKRQLDGPGHPGPTVSVTIPEGASTAGIANLLNREGIIGNPVVFRLYARLKGAGPLLAGDYELRKHDSMGHVIKVLEAGAPLHDRVTISEGLTLEQIADRVGRLPGHSKDGFLAVARGGQVHSQYQPPGSTNLEGLLGPGTYFVAKEDDDVKLLTRMVGTFDTMATAAGLQEGAARVHLSPYEVVVLGSLIEREAKVDEDRPLIARVIYNRLARDMFLQVDASVLYALPKHEGTRVSNRDLAVDSPYNTYRHKGLPPGPIGSPGQKALAAAIDPAPGPWLYYVLADANGKHAFAVTEAEFNRLKAEAHAKGLL